jgi:hypothetical protein
MVLAAGVGGLGKLRVESGWLMVGVERGGKTMEFEILDLRFAILTQNANMGSLTS